MQIIANTETRTGQVTVLIIGIAKTLRKNGSADKMISNCPCCEYCDHSIETYCTQNDIPPEMMVVEVEQLLPLGSDSLTDTFGGHGLHLSDIELRRKHNSDLDTQ